MFSITKRIATGAVFAIGVGTVGAQLVHNTRHASGSSEAVADSAEGRFYLPKSFDTLIGMMTKSTVGDIRITEYRDGHTTFSPIGTHDKPLTTLGMKCDNHRIALYKAASIGINAASIPTDIPVDTIHTPFSQAICDDNSMVGISEQIKEYQDEGVSVEHLFFS